MKAALKAFLKTLSGSVGAISFGIIATKIIASFSGPAGLGLFSILRQINQTCLGIASFQGVNPIVHGLSTKQSFEKSSYVISVGMTLLASTAIFSLIFWAFTPHLSILILDSSNPEDHFLIRGLIIAISFGIGTVFFTGILNSRRQIGRIALVQSVSGLGAALIAYPALLFFGVKEGSLLIIISIALFGFLSGLIFLIKDQQIKFKITSVLASINPKYIKQFLTYGITLVLAGLSATGTILLIRTLLLRYMGYTVVGMFDAAWTIGNSYFLLILSSLGTYFFPTLAQMRDPEEKDIFIKNTLRLMLLIEVPVIIVMLVIKPMLIELFYTSEFIPSLTLLRWFFIGDFFKAFGWVLATNMQINSDYKTYFFLELFSNALLACGGYLSLFVFNNIEGIGLTYLFLYFTYFLFCIFFSIIRYKISFIKTDLMLYGTGLFIIILTSYFTWNNIKPTAISFLVAISCVIFYLFFNTSSKERQQFIKFSKSISRQMKIK
jgi:O-antigen/teichoic acid export membrane protein